MAKCRHNQTDIMDYLMGELQADRKEGVERRIKSCITCQEQYQRTKMLIEQLTDNAKGLTDISQDDLFLFQLRERIDEQQNMGWFPKFAWPTLGALISILLILVMVQIYKGRKPASVQTFVKNQGPVKIDRLAGHDRSMPNIQLSSIKKPINWMQIPINTSSIYRPDFPSKPDIHIKINLFNKIPNS